MRCCFHQRSPRVRTEKQCVNSEYSVKFTRLKYRLAPGALARCKNEGNIRPCLLKACESLLEKPPVCTANEAALSPLQQENNLCRLRFVIPPDCIVQLSSSIVRLNRQTGSVEPFKTGNHSRSARFSKCSGREVFQKESSYGQPDNRMARSKQSA